MKLRGLVFATLCLASVAAGAQGRPEGSEHGDPPRLGEHWAKDGKAPVAHEARVGGSTSPNMTYHSGVVLQKTVVKAIFWGSSWAPSDDKITGLDAWYSGYGGSNYAKTVDEYGGSNGQVGPSSTYQGHILDTSAIPAGTNFSSTSPVLAEVCKQVAAGSSSGGTSGITVDSSGNGYYPVYTDVPRGSAGFCAWHSYGTCSASGKTRVQIAFFFKLDGDAGCDPVDTSGLHSQGLAALASVTAHELSEARSDPASPGAWYDSQGNENGDKCAWIFPVPLVTFADGTKWKLQGEWSNAAYTAGTGYPNSTGQKGCLSGL